MRNINSAGQKSASSLLPFFELIAPIYFYHAVAVDSLIVCYFLFGYYLFPSDNVHAALEGVETLPLQVVDGGRW